MKIVSTTIGSGFRLTPLSFLGSMESTAFTGIPMGLAALSLMNGLLRSRLMSFPLRKSGIEPISIEKDSSAEASMRPATRVISSSSIMKSVLTWVCAARVVPGPFSANCTDASPLRTNSLSMMSRIFSSSVLGVSWKLLVPSGRIFPAHNP